MGIGNHILAVQHIARQHVRDVAREASLRAILIRTQLIAVCRKSWPERDIVRTVVWSALETIVGCARIRFTFNDKLRGTRPDRAVWVNFANHALELSAFDSNGGA